MSDKIKLAVAHPLWFMGEIVILFGGTLLVLLLVPETLIFRWGVMAFGLIYIIIMQKALGFSRSRLGLTTSRRVGSIRKTVFSTLIIAIGIYGLSVALANKVIIPESFRSIKASKIIEIALFYSLISVPLQEFIFRGYLFARLRQFMKSKWRMIVISAVIFGIAHAPFRSMEMVLGAFILGIIWGWLYFSSRNLFTVIASHAMVGVFGAMILMK